MSDVPTSSRREFVKVAGSAALGASLFPVEVLGQTPAKRRYAIVGTGDRASGMWGRDLVSKYPDLLEFVGLCDKNPKRALVARDRCRYGREHRSIRLAIWQSHAWCRLRDQSGFVLRHLRRQGPVADGGAIPTLDQRADGVRAWSAWLSWRSLVGGRERQRNSRSRRSLLLVSASSTRADDTLKHDGTRVSCCRMARLFLVMIFALSLPRVAAAQDEPRLFAGALFGVSTLSADARS